MTHYPAARETRRDVLLVLAHGAGAGERHPFMTRHAQGLAARGLDVVTFDFPYMQNGRKVPDRAPILEKTFRDVIVAAVGEHLLSHRLFIGGKSMGGRMATHLAAAPETWPAGAPPLAGVIVLGYPLRPMSKAGAGTTGRAAPSASDRTTHLARITVPTLIVQGTRDSFGGPDDVRAAMPHAQVLALEGADHSPAARFDQAIWDGVLAFVSAT
jgi:uncharacterized protein